MEGSKLEVADVVHLPVMLLVKYNCTTQEEVEIGLDVLQLEVEVEVEVEEVELLLVPQEQLVQEEAEQLVC